MGYQHIEVELRDHLALLWLNRPEKLNALSADMWDDIPTAMGILDADDGVRTVVVAGRGPAFTVGIDIALLAGIQPEGESQAAANLALYHTIRRLQRTATCLAESPKPVIAAIHGHCLGAGMDLATACDIRLAARDATFSIRETRMGLVADVGTLQRLPAIVGPGHTAELAFTGSDIDADRALRIGLVNDVLPDAGATVEAALEIGARIADNSPLVVRGIKRVLAANEGRTVSEALDYAAHWNAAYLMSSDLMEAISAFAEKRKPDFTGN